MKKLILFTIAYCLSTYSMELDHAKQNQETIFNSLVDLIKQNDYKSFEEKLVATDFDVNYCSKLKEISQINLLHYAIANKSEAIIEILLRSGADVETQMIGRIVTEPDEISVSPIFIALVINSGKIVKTFLEFGAKTPNFFEIGVLFVSKICLVKSLIEPEFMVKYQRSNIFIRLLSQAAVAGTVKAQIDNIFMSLNYNEFSNLEKITMADINDNKIGCGMSPLMWACAQGKDELVKLLLHKANENFVTIDLSLTNIYHETPFALAHRNRRENVMHLLNLYIKPEFDTVKDNVILPIALIKLIFGYIYDNEWSQA